MPASKAPTPAAKPRAVNAASSAFPASVADLLAEWRELAKIQEAGMDWAGDFLLRNRGLSSDEYQKRMHAAPGFECYQRMIDTQDRYHALQKHPACRAAAAAERGTIVWASAAAEIEIPAVEPFVEGLIDQHEVGIEAGYTGSFKTQDALELAIATILPGKLWKGRRLLHNGPVLYLALEDASAIKHIRLPAAMDAMNLAPEERAAVLANFFMQPPGAAVKLPEAVDQIHDALDEIRSLVGECALVVFDTIREALSGSVSAEKDATPFMDALFDLAKHGGPTILAIGHVTKEDARRPLSEQSPKGLGDFLDRAAFVLMKARDKASNTTELYVLKSKNHAREYSIRHKLEPGPRGIPVQHVIEAAAPAEAKAPVARKSRARRRTS